jgi:3-hydroxybutyryl-CoA dehydratase
MSFTTMHLFFDDLEVGQEWTSAGRTVTVTDIVNFAGLSGDFNAIHVDHEFAKSTPFRQPIAHGLLVYSMGSGLGMYAPPVRTLAFMSILEWHFREPVFPGDTIRSLAKVMAKEERGRGRRGVVTWNRKVLNQSDKVVQEGTILTLVEGRANVAAKSMKEERERKPTGELEQ